MTHRVMLIDDSEADLLFTTIMLERSGEDYEVVAYESPRAALLDLERGVRAVDLILLDINMPGMNGFEFLEAYERLRVGQRARAVVVMLTSSPDATDRERARAFASVRGYVTKPIDQASAQSLVRLMVP